eukprot:8494290-Pyramimonas_sp.AAC.1
MEARRQRTVQRIYADMSNWYDRQEALGNPQKNRLNTLTPQIIRNKKKADFKAKAGERGGLVPWGVDVSRKMVLKSQKFETLAAAGECLLEWLSIIRANPESIPAHDAETLVELSLRHICLMQDYGATLLPKHHAWVHMSLRVPSHGNPRFHSCFLDESLNSKLRALCQISHGTTWEKSVFERVALAPIVDPKSHFAFVQ